MKLTKIILVAAVGLTNCYFAGAQSNGVPGPTDYTQFSTFVASRNIFDPARVPHRGYTPKPPSNNRGRGRLQNNSAPAFSLVGTMSYQKGVFAFFDGNNSDLKKVLPVNATIQGYTVLKIAQGRVLLETADKKEQLELKVGDVMRESGGKWEKTGAGGLPYGSSSPGEMISSFNSSTESLPASGSGSDSGSSTSSSSGSDSSVVAPSPALQANEVLKRLMELRKKEEQ
jgi:hypothetical protein